VVSVSVELRALRLADRYPDTVAPARVVRAATEHVLASAGEVGDIG
jgi:hypothetical protein